MTYYTLRIETLSKHMMKGKKERMMPTFASTSMNYRVSLCAGLLPEMKR